MTNKLCCVLLLFFTLSAAMAQDTVLQGKVISGSAGVDGVYVINKASGSEVKTVADGTFSIAAKPGDVLAVYSTNIIVRDFMLSAESFKDMPYVISVNYNGTDMDEIVITKYRNINAVSLGIVPANQKRYTVAERKLYAAGYGSIGLTSLINLLNGQMKILKSALATEKKEVVLEGIKGLYDEDDMHEKFNIPREKAAGFMYYLVEDKDFSLAVKAKNKDYLDFLLIGLSEKYLKLQEDAE